MASACPETLGRQSPVDAPPTTRRSSPDQLDPVPIPQSPRAPPQEDLDAVAYEFEALPGGHRLLKIKPTPAQWADFPSIFRLARRLGADAQGCFKMVLPPEMRDPLPARAPQRLPANAYRVRQIRSRLFWQVGTVKSEGVFSSAEADADPEADGSQSPEAALAALKTLFVRNKGRQMRNVRYRPDVPAWTPQQRWAAGVPPRSPVHPLRGDLLDHTKAIIPGIHTPYVYESGPHFGASFQMHAEDYRLTSLNHLYRGRKIWIVVPATAVDVAEAALGRNGRCSQFMRHRAEFLFPERLRRLGVPHRIVDQRPGETVVVLPDAYHQGFSTGYTLAEARNYADGQWSDLRYQPCERRCNLATAIPGDFMRRLQQGEERIDLCASYDLDLDLDVVARTDPPTGSSALGHGPEAHAPSAPEKRKLETSVELDGVEEPASKQVKVH